MDRQDKSINRRIGMTQEKEREDCAGQGQGTTVHVINERVKLYRTLERKVWTGRKRKY